MALELEHLRRKSDDLERYIGLAALQDRNEILFYRLLVEHLEELLPIVYTPTVGQACQEFSHILRRPRGLWITPADQRPHPPAARQRRQPRRAADRGDRQRAHPRPGRPGRRGYGDPRGEAGAVLGRRRHPPRPRRLPICLDVGTDNVALLEDPLYLGYRSPRLRGEAYDELVEAFVEGVLQVFPHALLQWEDFKQHNAIRLLDRYRHRITSFNDDIQGTAAVVLAGVLAALRATGEPLAAQRIVFLGAGAAGIGIARLLRVAMRQQGVAAQAIREAIVMLDSRGLVYEGRVPLDEDKREFALAVRGAASLRLPAGRRAGPGDGRPAGPAVTCWSARAARPGCFTEGAIREMARHDAGPGDPAAVQPHLQDRGPTRGHPGLDGRPGAGRDGQPVRSRA